MNDKWNTRLWLRHWLLRPSHAESTRINATAQGEPRAVGYGNSCSSEPLDGPFRVAYGEVRIDAAGATWGEPR